MQEGSGERMSTSICITHLAALGQAELPSHAEDVDDADERTRPVVCLRQHPALPAAVARRPERSVSLGLSPVCLLPDPLHSVNIFVLLHLH